MYTQTGNCPKCGSPIYSPSPWNGVTPPPQNFTCICNGANVYTVMPPVFKQPILENINPAQKSYSSNDEYMKEILDILKEMARRQKSIEELLFNALAKPKATFHD